MISLRDDIVHFGTMISKHRLGCGNIQFIRLSLQGATKLQHFAFIFISKNEAPPSSRVSPTAVPPLHTLRESTASALRGATLSTRIDRDISLIMPLRFVRQLRTQTAQSLVLFVKLGVRFLAAVAARVPSSKLHIQCTNNLRTSVSDQGFAFLNY